MRPQRHHDRVTEMANEPRNSQKTVTGSEADQPSSEPSATDEQGADKQAPTDANLQSFGPWLSLFGRDPLDESMSEALRRVGVDAESLRVGHSELSVMTDICKGITLTFKLLEENAYEPPPILCELSLFLISDAEDEDGNPSPSYERALPFELKRADSRDDLRKRFGIPLESEDDEYCVWDQWAVASYAVTVEYSDDKNSIKTITIEAP